jgi:hypothetical protein
LEKGKKQKSTAQKTFYCHKKQPYFGPNPFLYSSLKKILDMMITKKCKEKKREVYNNLVSLLFCKKGITSCWEKLLRD